MGRNDFGPLEAMTYSGRGIVVGKTPDGLTFVGYTLTDRSESSQARWLVQGEETGVLRTDVTNREQLEKGSPALLLYPAIMPVGERIVASNGAQTQLLYDVSDLASSKATPGWIVARAFGEPHSVYDPAKDRLIDLTTFEPDVPNNTPRISAVVDSDRATLYIVRSNAGRKEVSPIDIDLVPGKAFGITTYAGENLKPLPSFIGSPLEFNITTNSVGEIANGLFSAIEGGQNPGDNYQVAAAVMAMSRPGEFETQLRNRFGNSD